MLSGLASSAMLTALIAGIAGAWSPCGFSMVDTIGTALGDARRFPTLAACTTFTFGALAGGALTFGGLALAGALLAQHSDGLRETLGVVVALGAAIADWRGVRIAPQIRRQVPERWRWTLPLPLACALYGLLLGLGFTTFVLAFAVWALAGISFAAGSPLLGVLVGVAFGLGRALPILSMAPGLDRGAGARRLHEMAAEPRLWLGLRRLDALGLGLCAVFLGATAAAAAVLPAASDPSAAGGELAWQQVGGGGMLSNQSGQASALPGIDPALGPTSIAWLGNGQITIADSASLQVKATIPAGEVDALALSDGWLVYRADGSEGSEALIGVPLLAPEQRSLIVKAQPGEVGRPALVGSTVVFTLDTPSGSTIEALNLDTAARRVLRSSGSGFELQNPSLLGGRLLYERVDRCAQELRLGRPASARQDRVLLSLPSTVARDPGYQAGYEHAWNSASGCPNRSAAGRGTVRLGSTALAASTAYVTEIPASPTDAFIVALSR
jgi:hypothetical protein